MRTCAPCTRRALAVPTAIGHRRQGARGAGARRWVKLVVLALHSFWLPQIVSCARHDARQPLTPAYVLGMSASRLAAAVPARLPAQPAARAAQPALLRRARAVRCRSGAAGCSASKPPCPPRVLAAACCFCGTAVITYAVGSVVLARAFRCCRWLRPAARR